MQGKRQVNKPPLIFNLLYEVFNRKFCCFINKTEINLVAYKNFIKKEKNFVKMLKYV